MNKPKPDKYVMRWRNVVYRSKRKNVPCDITRDDIERINNTPCIYCLGSDTESELDRIKPELGYTLSNIVPACRRCNMVKNNILTFEEMLLVAKTLGWQKT